MHAQSLSHVWLFATPWSLASLSLGLSRLECWGGLPFRPQGDLPNPGIEPESPVSPPLILYIWDTWESLLYALYSHKACYMFKNIHSFVYSGLFTDAKPGCEFWRQHRAFSPLHMNLQAVNFQRLKRVFTHPVICLVYVAAWLCFCVLYCAVLCRV